ncbi:hypothetical protein HDU67_004791 [Dinochytrium kinnereticum]|nr:hypothetical protein HDU67_004791 [Dinochytrium kinnereticum]
MFATLLGNIPGAVLYSFIGSLVGSLAGAEKVEIDLRTKCITILFSLVFLAGSVIFITIVAKRALREATSNYETVESDPGGSETITVDGEVPDAVEVVQDDQSERTDLSQQALLSSGAATPRRRQTSASPDVVEEDVQELPRAPKGGYTAEEARVLTWTFAGMGFSVALGLPLIFILT